MENSQLIILTSPPASGKTYWIRSFIEAIEGVPLLVVSPLRALADECKEKWKDEISIVTPEEWLICKVQAPVVVFDEFHLNFYWGDTFRPIMWEVFFELASSSRLVVLLTATLSPEMEVEVRRFSSQFDEIYFCDYGNRTLKYSPARYVKAPSKRWITEMIETGPHGEGVNLIFCAYRNEVFEWEKRLTELGFRAWSCVGGEAGVMKERMRGERWPDFIVATSVLSHGVNLPEISCVFFLYPLKNLDFWIQMVARGGRKGERYEVISLENPHGIKWNRLLNLFRVLGLSLKIRINSIKQDIGQWFLKE